jgi:hypothetical protein
MNKFEKIIESNSHTVYANTQARVNLSFTQIINRQRNTMSQICQNLPLHARYQTLSL